jgi:hypothetical protein
MVRRTGNKGSEMRFWVSDPKQLEDWSPKIRAAESLPFFGDLRRQIACKPSTRVSMWAYDTFKMGCLISLRW